MHGGRHSWRCVLIPAGTQNFNLPHDVVSLPSGGLFYKSKKKTIKIGYLTANDENMLLGSLSMGNDSIVMSLLRSKIYEPDFVLPAISNFKM